MTDEQVNVDEAKTQKITLQKVDVASKTDPPVNTTVGVQALVQKTGKPEIKTLRTVDTKAKIE